MNRLTKYYIQKNAESVAATHRQIRAEMDKRQTFLSSADLAELDYCEKIREKAQRGRPVGEAGRRKTDQTPRASHAAEAYSMGSGETGNGMEDNCPIWEMGIALAQRDSVNA